MRDGGYRWIQDAGCRIQDAGYRMQDTGYRIGMREMISITGMRRCKGG